MLTRAFLVSRLRLTRFTPARGTLPGLGDGARDAPFTPIGAADFNSVGYAALLGRALLILPERAPDGHGIDAVHGGHFLDGYVVRVYHTAALTAPRQSAMTAASDA